MNPKLQQYLKVFLITGVSFGALMLLFDILNGEGLRFWSSIFRFVFFGLCMSLTFVTIQIANLKKAGVQKISSDDFKIIQKRVVQSDISKDELISKLREDPSFKKMGLTEIGNQILLKSKTTFSSWGEEILINISSGQNGMNEFDIISKPKIKTNIMDTGINYLNVRNLEKLIMNLA
ncbi:MAG: hypothetical protein ABJC12_11600 [Saprospiraceae bacterium]